MRVAICSSCNHKTPPEAYGSEVTAWYMVEELCRRGHEVHLIAAEGSENPPHGVLHTIGPLNLLNSHSEREASSRLLEVLTACDVVHDMSSTHAFADADHETGHDRHLTTINGISFATPHHKHNVCVLSEAARQAALSNTPAWGTDYPQFRIPPGQLPSCEVVHYGTDTEFYHPSTPDNYILYLGRPHPSKGVHKIIELARLIPDQRFVLAWRAEYPEHLAYEAQYKEMAASLRNVDIFEIPLEGHHTIKQGLYSMARAFIQPTQYQEAFGLTAIESLACGTPVILMNRGSAPEIVKHGETGFLCDSMGDLLTAVTQIGRIKRQRCRKDAIERFDKSVMCSRYVELYGRVLRGEQW